MPETLRFFDGQAYLEGSNQEPYPVKVMQDPQSRNITVSQDGSAQVVVSTSVVTLICPSNPLRRSVMLTNLTGTQLCHLGVVNTVSATTSRAVLTGAAGSSATFYTKDAIYGLSATAAQTVLVWEEEFSGN